MKSTLLFINVLFILLLCCCEPVTKITDLPGDVSGIVTDAETSEPLKDATIRLNPSSDSTTTGDEGEYLFENIPSETYEIEASKPAYETVSKDIEVKEAQVTEVNFGLSKTPSPQISPAFLDFSIDHNNLSFAISNAGSGTINYSISSSQNWITLSHLSGEVATETDTIIVSIDRSGLSDELIKENIYITFSINGNIEHENMDIFINGVVDQDGNYYRVVEIGTQIWMAENMNVGSMVKLNINWPQDNGIIEKFCYDNLESNCEIYGGLYTWNEMSHYTPPSTEMSDNFQGICPDGWHIPNELDINTLSETLGGEEIAGGKLKDTTSYWKQPNIGATNESGFGALPAGYTWYDSSHEPPWYFDELGIVLAFYTSFIIYNDVNQQYSGCGRILDNSSPAFAYGCGLIQQFSSLPVRCIKDSE